MPKINCILVFASHKDPTYILSTFVHMSFGLCFKNNVGFCNLYQNAWIYIFSSNYRFVKFWSKLCFHLIPCLLVFWKFAWLFDEKLTCNFF
jgi:hypothetical protein